MKVNTPTNAVLGAADCAKGAQRRIPRHTRDEPLAGSLQFHADCDFLHDVDIVSPRIAR